MYICIYKRDKGCIKLYIILVIFYPGEKVPFTLGWSPL